MRPDKAYNRIADEYDENYKDKLSLAENSLIFKYILPDFLTGGQLLDMGCGTGIFLDEIPRKYDPLDYVGLDISYGMLENARAKHPDHNFNMFEMDNGGKIWGSTYKNIIALFGVFNYSLDPDWWTSSLFKSLRKRGRFCVMVCSKRYVRGRKSYVLNGNEEVKKRYYCKEELENLFWWAEDLKITGMSRLLVNKNLKKWPQWLVNTIHWMEHRLLGKIAPDFFYYYIVTGKKKIG